MTDNDSDSLRARVTEFEDIIYRAKLSQFANDPPEVVSLFMAHDSLIGWRLLDLFDSYQAANVYPLDRLPGVIDRLIDTKLQLYFVSQVFPGTVNTLVYSRGYSHEDPLATPSLQLAQLCYAQAMIGGSRVLWERLMRFIYFLETGHDPAGKSIRTRFFRDLSKWSPRWDLLAEWEAEVDAYDRYYRTPEYHKGSVLKKELLGGDAVDPNQVLSLLTPVMNGVWTIISCNIAGTPHNILRLGHNVPRLSDHKMP